MLIIHSFEDPDAEEEVDKDRIISHLFKIIHKMDPDTSYEDIAALLAANMAIEDMERGLDDFNVERN